MHTSYLLYHLQDLKSVSKMMSGVELNALMNQVAETGTLPPSFQQNQASKPYNRELWRIQNGMLEKSLVNFVVDKSRQKKSAAIGN